MKRPTVTIVIPTRGRPDLLKDAITSALLQNHADFEVYVSDNFNDERTERVVRSFRDPRLKYVRTTHLMNMPDHWEFASQLGSGEFITFLTDRSVLKAGSIEFAASEMEKYPGTEICAWRWSMFDDDGGFEFNDFDLSAGEVELLKSSDLISEFCNGHSANILYHRVPLPNSAMFSRSLANRIRASSGRFVWGATPDITAGFLMLDHSSSILFIDKPLFIAQGLKVSNGLRAYGGQDTGYMETLDVTFGRTPFKGELISSILFEDFLAMQEKSVGELAASKLRMARYYAFCLNEIERGYQVNAIPVSRYSHLMDKWRTGVAELDAEERSVVWRFCWKLRLSILKMQLKRIVSAVGIKGPVRKVREASRTKRNAMQCAGFNV